MHHVHAHTAPGNLGDFFSRGKPRLHDELQDIAIRHHGVRIEQATQDGFTADRFEGYPGTVVMHVEHHVAAFIGQLKGDMPLLRLATGVADVTRLQAVVNRIAQHVFEGRDHAFQHGAVNFGFGIDDAEFNLLAQLIGDLPNDTLEARQYALEGHHAGAHQAFL